MRPGGGKGGGVAAALPRIVLLLAAATAGALLTSLRCSSTSSGTSSSGGGGTAVHLTVRRAGGHVPAPSSSAQGGEQQQQAQELQHQQQGQQQQAEELEQQQQPPAEEPPGDAPLLPRNISGPVAASVVTFQGIKLTVVGLMQDEHVSNYVVRERAPYDAGFFALLLARVRPGAVVVDVGAHIGSYSIFFAAKAGPTGRVYSFEPQSRMFAVLCTNMVVNSLIGTMRPHHMALSYEPGTLSMSAKVSDGNSEGKTLVHAEADASSKINYGGMRLGAGGERVTAATLDSFNLTAPCVSLLKIDAQWAEHLVMYGARETIKRCLPVIAFEQEQRRENVQQMAKELGVPQHVQEWDASRFLADLGYKAMPGVTAWGGDAIMLPPSQQQRARRRGVRQEPAPGRRARRS